MARNRLLVCDICGEIKKGKRRMSVCGLTQLENNLINGIRTRHKLYCHFPDYNYETYHHHKMKYHKVMCIDCYQPYIRVYKIMRKFIHKYVKLYGMAYVRNIHNGKYLNYNLPVYAKNWY